MSKMLDINLIRANPEGMRKSLLKRMDRVDFSELLENDKEYRRLTVEADNLKSKRNNVSAAIPRLKKEGQDVCCLVEEMKVVAESIKEIDSRRLELQKEIKEFLESLPNVPADDVPAGDKGNNEVIRTFGDKPGFSFEPKDHLELVTSLGAVDYERGVKLAGTGFWLYRGDGARIEWALLQYFVEEHLNDGYEMMIPPHILNWESGVTAGQFPKYKDDVFILKSSEEDDEHTKFLLPTAETALINIFRDETLLEEELPKKMFSYTPCYRKEAGTYRASERGMIRGHQFNKVEMFIYCKPEDSDAAHEELIKKAEKLVRGLGLHHRVSKLAARDTSPPMARTVDIEVWIPSMNDYKEVSSASTCRDYQARRGSIRYKDGETGKNFYLHTLNASGLATSRIIPAIFEQFQQEDGSVIVPEVLRKWMGKNKIEPVACR
jgi:seryl-tRNA synthetase